MCLSKNLMGRASIFVKRSFLILIRVVVEILSIMREYTKLENAPSTYIPAITARIDTNFVLFHEPDFIASSILSIRGLRR